MSLPPANTDPAIRPLRALLQSVYTPIFTTFPLLQTLITRLSSQVSTLPLIRDDIAWSKEALDGDVEKLSKIQGHIKFLGAEETHTTQEEMMTVFEEVCDFTQLILLDDFVTILSGVSESLRPNEKDVCVVNGNALVDVVAEVKKFAISLKIVCKPVRDAETTLTVDEVKLLERSIQPKLDDLENRFDALMRLV